MPILHTLEKIFHARPAAIGCELSDENIRFVMLGEKNGILELKGFGCQGVSEGAICNGVIREPEKVRDALRLVAHSIRSQGIRSSYVVISFPESQCFLRIVPLPRLSAAEISEAIKWEIEANIPLPIADVYYDWQRSADPEMRDHLDVLVAAVPRDLVDSYLRLFSDVGLKTLSCEIDALALSRSIIPACRGNNGAAMIIKISKNWATYIIHAGEFTRFTASAAVSNDGQSSLAKNFISSVAAQARQYMDFFSSHSTHAHAAQAEVKQVYLCGDYAFLEGLSSPLAMALGIPVAIANPWANILQASLREVPALPWKESLGYSAALGLALRGYRGFSADDTVCEVRSNPTATAEKSVGLKK